MTPFPGTNATAAAPLPGTPPPATEPAAATATTNAIWPSEKADTKTWTGETEDPQKIGTLKHRDCVLATPPPSPPEATPLAGNVPEAANGEGLAHAHLPEAHKVGGARSDMTLL